MHLRERHQLRRCGVTIVEAAFVISLALLFLYSVFEYGRYLMVLDMANNAAREGARYAVVHTGDGTTQANVLAVVSQRMAGVDQQLQGYNATVFTVDMTGIYNTSTNSYNYPSSPNLNAQANSNWNDAQFGHAIAVQITGTYKPVLPSLIFLNVSLPIQVTALMNSEAN